jgi:unspecific monooxygenase
MLSSDNEIATENHPVIYSQERLAMQKADASSKRSDLPIISNQPYPRRLEIASDMYDHNAAAHETSGDTLTYVSFELSRRPVLQAQLWAKLNTLSPSILYPFQEGSSKTLPDPKAIDALPLFDVILQETLRK